MIKIVHINSMKNGSTGTIMDSLAKAGRNAGMQVYTSCAGNLYQRRLPTKHPEFHLYIGGILENKLHKTLGTLLGCGGCFSWLGTFVFLRKLDRIRPDIIHLHNLHSNFINLRMLFRYIQKNRIALVWTLHDCWPFTGHCTYFEMAGCYKWKSKCRKCPQYRKYPEASLDDAAFMHRWKRKYFTLPEQAVIVTPSAWLADLTKQSFLKKYSVSVIHNGIDLKIFHPVPSDFRQKYHLENKIIILGVAFSWGYRKGLDIFVRLAEKLPEQYQIVLAGITEQDRKSLPDNIVTIELTNTISDLAPIYSAADIFLNPTREDNFPTTHLESLACGTPVITFRAGGAPESIDDFCGAVVEKEDIDGLVHAVKRLTDQKIPAESCTRQALLFDLEKQAQQYLSLYRNIAGGKRSGGHTSPEN